jgi:hypothetical protein
LYKPVPCCVTTKTAGNGRTVKFGSETTKAHSSNRNKICVQNYNLNATLNISVIITSLLEQKKIIFMFSAFMPSLNNEQDMNAKYGGCVMFHPVH